jgi:hypothetical protein
MRPTVRTLSVDLKVCARLPVFVGALWVALVDPSAPRADSVAVLISCCPSGVARCGNPENPGVVRRAAIPFTCEATAGAEEAVVMTCTPG